MRPATSTLLTLLTACVIASPRRGVVVETTATDTEVAPAGTEALEDPNVGNRLAGCFVKEWRDADHDKNSPRPHRDWTATRFVDGSATQVWLRGQGTSITTTTTSPTARIPTAPRSALDSTTTATDSPTMCLLRRCLLLPVAAGPSRRVLAATVAMHSGSGKVAAMRGTGARSRSASAASVGTVSRSSFASRFRPEATTTSTFLGISARLPAAPRTAREPMRR